MVQTELKFVRLMEELDEAREEMSDLGGEYNSITDNCADFKTHDEHGDITKNAQAHLDEIDLVIEKLEGDVEDIAYQLGIPTNILETHFDSCITNRWEIYAHIHGAEIVSLVDIANGKA